MRTLAKIIRFQSNLSIDIGLGGVGLGHFFSQFLGIPTPEYWLLVLFFSILSVYNLDHWIDSTKGIDFSSNPRRFFFIRYKSYILLFIAITSLLSIGLGMVYLNTNHILLGFGLFFFSLIFFYLSYNYSYIPKEFITAIIYIAGVLFVPFMEYTKNFKEGMDSFAIPESSPPVFLALSLFFLAFQNLITNSLLDYKDDKREGFSNIVNLLGFHKTNLLIILCGILGVGLFFSTVFMISLPDSGFPFREIGETLSLLGMAMLLFLYPNWVVVRGVDFPIFPYKSTGDLSFAGFSLVLILFSLFNS